MLRSHLRRDSSRLLQRGLSVVELMVGVAIGLVIVAGATVMMSGQMVENRRLLMEAQIQQDLRSAADIITRDLRRSAYLAEIQIGGTPSSLQTLDTVAYATPNIVSPATARRNTFQSRLAGTSACTSSAQLTFAYVSWERAASPPTSPDVVYSIANGVLSTSQLGNLPQALTDGNTMNVTEFCVALSAATSVRLPCAKLCSGNSTSCWPTYQVRTATITIKAEGRGVNSNIKREITSTVRLRNDSVNFAAVVSLPSGSVVQACPA